MLKPAAMYKDILMEKFTSVLYTEDYYYYCGYPGTGLPEIIIEDGTYSYAIIDKNNNVIGFFTYQIFDLTDTVHNFGVFSFDKGNPIVGIDVYYKMKELIKNLNSKEKEYSKLFSVIYSFIYSLTAASCHSQLPTPPPNKAHK